MPGFVLHVGATVMCAHGGQAQPTAPNPRVLVSGQPITTMTAPYVVAGCPFNVSGAPVAVRDRDVDDRGNARDVERAAGTAARQPGPLRAERHTAVDRDDADTGDAI